MRPIDRRPQKIGFLAYGVALSKGMDGLNSAECNGLGGQTGEFFEVSGFGGGGIGMTLERLTVQLKLYKS